MEAELKEKGVDLVLAMAVNDAAVMRAWAKSLDLEGTIIKCYGDIRCDLTEKLGMTLHSLPGKFGYMRCKRFAMIIENGVIKHTNVCATDDDPVGDSVPEKSFAKAVLPLL